MGYINAIILRILFLKSTEAITRCREYQNYPGNYCCGPDAKTDYCELYSGSLIPCNGQCNAGNSAPGDSSYECKDDGTCQGLDCTLYSLKDFGTHTFQYTSGSSQGIGTGYNSFFTLPGADCLPFECTLKPLGCDGNLKFQYISIQATDPYQLIAQTGQIAGWTESFCFQCETNVAPILYQFDNIQVTQLPFDCSSNLSNLSFINPTFAYSTSGTASVGAGYTSFFSITDTQCQPTSCSLKAAGCSTAYGGSYVSMTSTDPYQLTASIGILNGWTETFCFVCSISGAPFEAQFDNIIVTQTPIDCSVYDTILPFPRQIFEFQQSTTVNVGSGYPSFISFTEPNCLISQCDLMDSGCGSAYSGSKIQISNTDPYQLSAFIGQMEGYLEKFCLNIVVTGGINSFQFPFEVEVEQSQLDCNMKLSPINFANQNYVFAEGGSIGVGSGFSSFLSITDPNCAVSSCEIKAAGCTTAYQGQYLSIDPLSPYQISANTGIPAGWAETVCFQCSISGGMVPTTFQHDNYQVSQNSLDCNTHLTSMNYGNQIFDYVFGGTANVGSGYSSFLTLSNQNCQISQCELRQVGCAALFSSNHISMDKTDPFQISVIISEELGWTETFCVFCSVSGGGVSTTFQHDNYQVSQLPLDCNKKFTLLDYPNQQYEYLSDSLANVGSGFQSFFQLTDANCIINSCELRQVGCATAYSGSYVSIDGANSSFQIKANIGMQLEWVETLCFYCTINGGGFPTAISQDNFQISQIPLDCNKKISALNYKNQQLEYEAGALSTIADSSKFLELTDTFCIISSCELRNVGCVTQYSGKNLQIDISYPYQLTANKGFLLGWVEEFCYQCSISGGGVAPVTFQQDKIQIEQLQIPCTATVQTKEFVHKAFQYKDSQTKVQVGDHRSFMIVNQEIACPVTNCFFRSTDCKLEYSPKYVQIDKQFPWMISAFQNVNSGYTESFCLRCFYGKENYIIDHQKILVTQYPDTKKEVDCSKFVSKKTIPSKVIHYDPIVKDQLFIGKPDFFFLNTYKFACPEKCELYESNCNSKLSYEENVKLCDPNLENCPMENNYWIFADSNIFDGYQKLICFECQFGENLKISQVWSVTQLPSKESTNYNENIETTNRFQRSQDDIFTGDELGDDFSEQLTRIIAGKYGIEINNLDKKQLQMLININENILLEQNKVNYEAQITNSFKDYIQKINDPQKKLEAALKYFNSQLPKIQKVSMDGSIIIIEFDKDMLNNKQIIAKINDQIMKVSIISAEDESKFTGSKDRLLNVDLTKKALQEENQQVADLMFYWKIEKFEGKQLSISMHFLNEKNVSQSQKGWDKVEVMILNQYSIQSSEMRLLSSESLYKPYPVSVKPIYESASIGAAADVMQGVAATQVVLSILMGFGIQEVWAMLNSMNIVLHLGVVKCSIPGNTFFVFDMLAKFVIQEVIPTYYFFEYFNIEFRKKPGYNQEYVRMGYESRNFIQGMEQDFFIIVFSLFVFTYQQILGSIAKRNLESPFWRRVGSKVHHSASGQAISRIVQMEYLSSLIVSISSATVVDKQDFDDPYNGTSAVLSIISTLFFVIFPVYNIIKIVINFDDLRDKGFNKKYGWLYQEVGTTYVSKSIYYGMFYLRRLIYVGILILFRDYSIFQLQGHLFLCSLNLIYLGNYNPLIIKNLNRLEIFNEVCIIICTYFFMCFLDESYSPEARFSFGNVFNAAFFFNIFINISYNIVGMIKKFRLIKQLCKNKVNFKKKQMKEWWELRQLKQSDRELYDKIVAQNRKQKQRRELIIQQIQQKEFLQFVDPDQKIVNNNQIIPEEEIEIMQEEEKVADQQEEVKQAEPLVPQIFEMLNYTFGEEQANIDIEKEDINNRRTEQIAENEPRKPILGIDIPITLKVDPIKSFTPRQPSHTDVQEQTKKKDFKSDKKRDPKTDPVEQANAKNVFDLDLLIQQQQKYNKPIIKKGRIELIKQSANNQFKVPEDKKYKLERRLNRLQRQIEQEQDQERKKIMVDFRDSALADWEDYKI